MKSDAILIACSSAFAIYEAACLPLGLTPWLHAIALACHLTVIGLILRPALRKLAEAIRARGEACPAKPQPTPAR